MLMNDFGLNRQGSSPLLRVTKPSSHVLDALAMLAQAGAAAITATIEAVEAWHRKRRTYQELAKLDDHLLRDIGLTRDGIPSCVAHLEAEHRRQLKFARRR